MQEDRTIKMSVYFTHTGIRRIELLLVTFFLSNELRSIPMLMGPRKIGFKKNTWASDAHVVAFESPPAGPG